MMFAMTHSFLQRRLLIVALLVGLVVLLPACGGMGDNEDDDGAFPEPPDRPNSAQVVTPVPNPGGEPRSLATGRYG